MIPAGLSTIFLVLGGVECAVFLAAYLVLRLARVRDVRWTIGVVVAAAMTYLATFAAMLVMGLASR